MGEEIRIFGQKYLRFTPEHFQAKILYKERIERICCLFRKTRVFEGEMIQLLMLMLTLVVEIVDEGPQIRSLTLPHCPPQPVTLSSIGE